MQCPGFKILFSFDKFKGQEINYLACFIEIISINEMTKISYFISNYA